MIRELWEDRILGEGFGESTFKLFESNDGLEDMNAPPYFVVWLHGMHNGLIGEKDLRTMQWRLGRKVIFMVPLSPKPCDGLHFNWGCAFTKQQNKKELGFVFGYLHYNYLRAFTDKIVELANWFNSERVLIMGYSMGGFGAIQAGTFAPEAFDAVVSVAGYGLGTSEAKSGYGAPQPRSGYIFEEFLEKEAAKLAKVPVFLAVHAPSDMCSSFRDVSAIIKKTQDTAWQTWAPSTAKLVQVPDWMANSDHPNKKRKSNHAYFNCTLLHNGSEQMLWAELRRLLETAPPRQLSSAWPPASAPAPALPEAWSQWQPWEPWRKRRQVGRWTQEVTAWA
ncbi:unnamed protein product [Effrenium voratum]|uniref:Uncharacterized protein n=1 Tax=Effrenium voratum TaxID=2562239 RepID=A0AA36HPS3_9DINO|nr:unnamed protein product [Effrenium voratum]CAJ1373058.1 unnamed protein product [Effrenium voratum]CAJ1431894.1 unnamed protein product [Effrenium voratum]